MTELTVMDAIGRALFTILSSAAPPLLMGLSVGLLVSVFQTVTSIQEQTLAFVPKIVAVFVSLLFFGPFILGNIVGFFQEMVRSLPTAVIP